MISPLSVLSLSAPDSRHFSPFFMLFTSSPLMLLWNGTTIKSDASERFFFRERNLSPIDSHTREQGKIHHQQVFRLGYMGSVKIGTHICDTNSWWNSAENLQRFVGCFYLILVTANHSWFSLPRRLFLSASQRLARNHQGMSCQRSIVEKEAQRLFDWNSNDRSLTTWAWCWRL